MSHWILLLSLSTGLTVATGCTMPGEEEEASETQLALADVPSAVQATITKEAGNGKINEVEKETRKDGKVVYEAEVMIDGKEHDILVAEDGTLLGKEADDEEDDDDDGEDDDDDDGEDDD